MMELKNMDIFSLYKSYIPEQIQHKIDSHINKTKSDFIRKANESKVEEIIKLDYSRFNLINKWSKNNKARLE